MSACKPLLDVRDLPTKFIIVGVKQTFLEAMSMNNAKSREIQLNTAYGDINKGISILQAKIESYIAQTRVIDEMPRYKRILKSPVLLKNIDSYNSIAKTLMDAWIEAVKVKMLLWSTPELTNNSDVYQDAITYVEGLNLRLMHDYDKDSSKEYWLKVHSRVKELKKGIPYQQLALEYCEEEIDYKNIEFN